MSGKTYSNNYCRKDRKVVYSNSCQLLIKNAKDSTAERNEGPTA